MYKFVENKMWKTTQHTFKILLNLLSKYYFILIGLYFLHKTLHLVQYPSISLTSKIYLGMLALMCFTVYSDIRNDIKVIPFLILCIPFFAFIFYIEQHGYAFWGKMLSWQISRKIVVDLNPIFSKIPFNNGSFARIYKTETLTWFFRMVYNNGFVLPVLLAVYRSTLAKDFKKMLRYILSAHVVQIFLITPFYLAFHLQEVWFVLGQPDGLDRQLSPSAAAGVTLNCFPSMHTSICFAMFLLVLRERNKIWKCVFGFFCLSVIFSTLYLEVHWVIDVFAGMILAYVTVKLVDFILAKGKVLVQKPLDMLYYKKKKAIYVSNYYLETMKY
ncbi:phosphatase PAP2 family protein [Clostridium autoethanogenum]|uniref:Phosphatase PAP2 family protein n=1 Tax=Clostridium autoethanogenum DSM 10061 TaxID=1341692 RepID=A0ABN4BDZ4_9CLOT|nr:phosphatase PAP2 family protein [Clostridium autoethanogenum]AGY75904.1 phosphatase PAP2 family protein [Clostridium autoethanogenum DSM 10061]ALU36070.1 Phosphoesterase PA-phosphatase related protein [Clostridium autoethanogenum DSM 10061]OVY51872.1 undecaprenyl pyrophosphate phosphatase [Clostridium autoethanogenum]